MNHYYFVIIVMRPYIRNVVIHRFITFLKVILLAQHVATMVQPNRHQIEKKSETKTPTRSLRSKTVSEEKLSPVLTRPVAQLIDGMSNFFLPNKDKLNNNTNNNNKRQQSVQKAMKFLRNKNSKNKNQLIARSILASSKTPRVRRKPVTLTDEPATAVLSSEHTTNVRRSMTKTPTRRSDEELPTKKKRKHSISSITQTPVNVKKKLKRKESKTEDEQEEEEQEEEEEEEAEKPKIEKRKLNLDLSSKEISFLLILKFHYLIDGFRISNTTFISTRFSS